MTRTGRPRDDYQRTIAVIAAHRCGMDERAVELFADISDEVTCLDDDGEGFEFRVEMPDIEARIRWDGDGFDGPSSTIELLARIVRQRDQRIRELTAERDSADRDEVKWGVRADLNAIERDVARKRVEELRAALVEACDLASSLNEREHLNSYGRYARNEQRIARLRRIAGGENT